MSAACENGHREAPERGARAGQSHGRRHRRQRPQGRRRDSAGARRGRQPRGVPRAHPHRVSARGPASEDELPRRRTGGPRRAGRSDARNRGFGGLPGAGGRRLQLRRRPRRRPRGRDIPQDPPAQLRRLRRAALLPGRLGARPVRARRRAHRRHDLRGHLGAGPSGHRRGPGRRRGDREPLRLALPRGQGPGARADACAAGARQPGRGGLLQPGGRPGRARLRRPQRGHRPGRRTAGARAPVRGGLRHLRRGPGSGRGRAPARPAPPVRQAPGRRGGRLPHAHRARRRGAGRGGGRRRDPLLDPEAEVYAALRTGLHDYVEKNRFERVVLALSGVSTPPSPR